MWCRGDAPKSMLCREFGINIDGGYTGLGTFKATLLSLHNPSLLSFELIEDIEADPMKSSSILCRRRPLRITYVSRPSAMSMPGGITSSVQSGEK